MTALLSYSPAITVCETYNYVWGYSASSSSTLFLTLKSGGTVKGRGIARTDGMGYFSGEFFDQGRRVDIAPGDTVEVSNGSVTTVEVPTITGSVDPVADVVSGAITGVPNPVSLVIDILPYPGEAPQPNMAQTVTTDASGNFSADFSAQVDIGADYVAKVTYTDTNGNHVHSHLYVQAINVYEQFDRVFGYATPGASVSITVKDSGGSTKATTTTTGNSDDGYYDVSFDVDIVPGDTVEVTMDGTTRSVAVADLTATVDLAEDDVSGTAPSDSTVRIYVWHPTEAQWEFYPKTVVADGIGNYIADYTGVLNIGRYDYVYVTCPDGDGDEAILYYHPPLACVNVTYNNVWGIAEAGAAVTATLKDNGGSIKDVQVVTVNSWGYYEPGFSEDVVTGDTVEVSGGGISATIPVQNLTADVDLAADTISGMVPASRPMIVRGWRSYAPGFDRTLTSEAGGAYSLDLSGQVDLYNGYEGHVYYSQADDHKVFLHYHTPVVHVNQTHDGVWGFVAAPDVPVTVTVKSVTDTVKASVVVTSNFENHFNAFYDSSVDIVPGDTVEVSTNPWSNTVEVVSISVSVDPDSDMVSGTAPPDSLVRVQVWDGEHGDMLVPTDSSGNFMADFSADVDIKSGNWVRVGYENADHNEVYAYYIIPYVRVNQSHDWVQGHVQPNVPVTAALLAPDSTVKGVGTTWSGGDGWFHTDFWDEWDDRADVQADDTVQVEAGDEFFDVFVIPMTGDVDPAADTVCGQMFDGDFPAPFFVDIWGAEGDTHREGTTDEFGNYCADYSGSLDIRDGHEAFIVYTNPDGNQVGIVRSYLRVGVGITGDWLDIATAPGADITATLWSAGYGEVKDTQYRTTNDDGRTWLGFDANIVPGDIVEVAADGRLVSLDVVDLSASGDPDTDTVSGTAPPDSYVETEVWGHGDDHWEDTTSDEFGNWSIYFGDEYDIQPGDEGHAWWTHDDGHWFQVDFTVPQIQVHFRNYDWVQGRVAPNAWVDITLRDSLGEVKGTYSDWAGGDGWFGGWCILNEYGDCVDIAPGDTVEVVYDGSDPILVPVIEITGIVDSAANTISGQILADDLPTEAWTDIWWTREGAGLGFSTDEFGNYFVDYSPYDVLPGHWVNIWYTNPDGHQLGAIFSELRLDVHVSHDHVDGITDPGRTVTLTLRAPDSSIKEQATDIANYEGQFGAGFSEDIAPGDTVEATTNPETSVYIEDITIDVDVDADTVCGTAPPDAWLQVGIHGGPWWDLAADEFGDYCADFSHEYDIQPGDEGEVRYESPEGHWLYYSFFVPYESYVEVQQSHDWVGGRTPYPDSWVEITLKDNLGAVKGTYSDWASGDGWFGGWCVRDEYDDCVDILAGDTVEVVYDGGDPIIVPVIEIRGTVDSAANTITGQILADTLPAQGRAEIWWTRDGADQDFTTDGAGNYTVDFSPYDVLPGHWVNIRYFNPDGNQVMAIFSELRLDVDVNHDDLDGLTDPGRTVTLTLRAPDGSVKDEATDIANDDGRFWAGFSEDIAPGDTVEAVANPSTSVYIEDVTIDVDVDADTVCGTAPPDAWLHVGIHGGPWWDLAADDSGNYCADFSDEYDIQPGDRAEVRYESPEGHRLYYGYFAPLVRVNQSHDWVEGRAPLPNTWVTITVTDGFGSVKGTFGDWSRRDGWFGSWCVLDERDDCVDIVAGDTVQVEASDSFFDVFVIPMTGDVDPTAETVCGQMFDGVFPAPFFVDIWGIGGDTHREGTTDEFGNYCADYSGSLDIRDGHEAFIVYTNPDGNQVGIVRSALRVEVNISHDNLWGSTAPGATVAITVTGSGVKGTASTVADDEGNYWTEVYTDGEQVDILPGDSVYAAAAGNTATVVIPDPFTAEMDVDADTVYGEAPAGAELRVEVYGYGDERLTVEPDGTWSVWFGDQGDLQAGDRGEVRYYTDEGHEVELQFYSPFLQANVNQSHEWVNGETTPDSVINATLWRDGDVVGWGTDYNGSGTWWHINIHDEWGDCCVDIQAGDMVEVETSQGLTATIEVIPMTGEVDANAETIAGQLFDVPFPADVQGEVWEEDGPGVDGQTNEFGNYLIDFSPFNVKAGYMVALWYVRPDGHRVGIVRHALRFADVDTARDSVAGNTWANVPVTVTVNGGETVTTTSDEEGYFETEFDTDIGVGDVVEAWAGTGTQYTSLTVEELSAWVDDPEDRVWGYGPPETYVEVSVDDDWRDTWTDDTGYYEVQYDWDIGPWNRLRAKYYHEGHSVMFGFGPSDVGVDKWVRPWHVVPGDEFSYFIRYWNSSDAPASDVIITDTLPYPVAYLWDSSGTTPTIDHETNTLVWHLGTLAAHRERTFELRVRMDEDAPLWEDFQNWVEISDPGDSDPEDNQDDQWVHTREPFVDVGIDKWLDEGRAFAGAELTYVLEYYNGGSRTAHDVVITDTLPSHTALVDTTFESGVDGISEWVDEAAGLVVWEIGALEPGESQDFQLTVRVLEGSPMGVLLVNWAEITTDDDDTWSGNDWDTDTQVVEPYLPDLWVEKWVESDVSSLDHDVVYRIEYHNDGPADAHNVVLTDTLPLSMTHLSHSAWTTATVADDQVIWELGTVAAGHGGYLYLTTHIEQPVAVNTVFTNTVDISTTDAETDYLNNRYVDVLGPPRVICVPWVGTHPHRVWSGLTTTLKGTAKGYGLTMYEWDPGDGNPVYSGTVGDPYVIEESHAYGAPVGTVYTATLTVWGAFGWSDTDTYTVRVFSPTHGVEVDVAIDEGLWYIHREANRYSSGGLPFAEWETRGYGVAETASAVQAFQVQGHRPGGDPWEDPYVEDVQCGWNALFTYANLDALTVQPAGDPDGDGDGVGIGIYHHTGSSIYESGLAMMALATTGSPGRVAHTGPPVYVRGQTYVSIAQDMADWFAWGQNDDWSGWARGGWRYRPNSGDSDNSNTQFPILGLAAAEHTWGITVPSWVKDELRDYWLAYTQDSSGGFGYMHPGDWVNVGKTGAGIMGLTWTGVPITDTRVISAAQFIEAHWYDTPDGNWNGNVGEMYAMYAVKKGSQLAGIQWYGSHNWNYEYSSWLVGVQWPDGSFDDAGNFGGWQPMATSWAVMILSPGLYRPLPVPVIAPIHYGGIGAEWGDGEVLFDASESHHTDPDREIILYEWDFGDGSPVETTPDPITTHTYAARGAYAATLTVWDDAGASASAATLVNITAPDYPPVADPDGPYVAYVDRPLTLDGSGSYDPDEWMGDAVVEYQWDFGDGDVVSTALPTVEHAWSAEGLYTVTLEVRDRGPEYGLDSPQWSTPVETTVTVSKWVPLRIFIYDDYEESNYADSLREYLESQGHYVTYSHDNVGNIDVWADYADYDVILAIHTCGSGTLTNLQTWFQSGRGYVAMLGGGMWNDSPEDDYIMNLLGVGTDGNVGEGWSPHQLAWTDPAHPIAHAPNSGWDITGIPAGQYQYYIDITDGHTVVSGPEGAVVQSREGVEDAARIVVIGTNYHGDDRADPEARYLVENALTWASGFRSAVWVIPSYQWQAGAAGTTVSYQVRVVNRVSHDDTFALAVADNIWPTTIWDETGATEIADTGLIPDNDFVTVTVKVEIPAGVGSGESDWARIIATSVSDPDISDEAEVETLGPDVPAQVAVAAIPPHVMPGGDTTTIEARVTDENGIQVVDGTEVTFTVGSGQGTVYPTTGTTVSGVVNVTFTSGPDCGLARVDVDAGTASGFTTVSVGDAVPTDVPGGSITSDTTWTACASPYLVHGDLFVEPGVTLTVEPGVQARFDGDTGLYVLGTLSALGQPDNQIAFTANEDWPWPGYWKGLTFGDSDHAADGGLEQVIVDYAGQWQHWSGGDFAAGVLIYRGEPHITHSLIRRNLGDGLWAARDSLPLIADNHILENGGGIAMLSAYLVASDTPIPSGEEADVWWRYLAFSTPGAGWNSDLDFDDSTWSTGLTPIGDVWNYKTYLDLEGDTMYARKIVTPASPLATNYYLRVNRDDMVTIWVNGVAVYADTQGGGPQWTSYIPVTLTPGPNLIAVELQDSGLGANYFNLELAGGSLQRATISGNVLRGNGTNGWAGIYISNSSPLVQGNEVAWNHRDGILMEGYSAPIIENNLVHHNGGDGIYFRDEVLPMIFNNTIDRNGGAGTSWDWSSVPEVVNNIITNNGEAGIACGGWRMAIRYNDVWNNQGDYSGCDVGEGNISQDPWFVDGPGGDYHLQAGSPCIDAGTTEGAPDHDFEGDPRPMGAGVDMGADEYYYSAVISEVRVTNVRDTSFTVSWITDIPSDGHVSYGTDPATLDQTAYDDRSEGTFDDTHYVTLLGLIPETTYYFDVVSGPTIDDNDGAHYTVTTGPTLSPPASDTIYGQVFKEDETTPAEGTIVYITLFDDDGSGSPDEAAPLSALVDDTGYWYANLGNARTGDLSAYFTYSTSGDKLKLEAQGAGDGTGYEPAVDTGNDTPAPTIYLSHTVFREIPLQIGWNHISLPLDLLTPYTAEGVCDEIISQGGDVAEIDRWYASGWDGHICGLPFNDFAIELGADYFIKSNAVSTWTIEGYEVTTPVPLELQIGWNSIGIPHTDAYTAESLCDEINDQCGDGAAVEVDRWYASGWDGHICGLPFNNFAIEIGTGYFVKAGGNCTVTPSLAATSIGRWRMENGERTMDDFPPSIFSLLPSLFHREAAIVRVKVTNVRDTSFTVLWSTDVAVPGWVNYGTSPALGQTAYDDRGAKVIGRSHHVTLQGLSPGTTYRFEVVSGVTVDDNRGRHYQVTTGPTLDLPASHTIYGRVLESDGVTPAEGAIVYVTLRDADGVGSPGESGVMTTLVGADGWWQANLGNARVADGKGHFTYSAAGDNVVLVARGADGGFASRTVDTGDLGSGVLLVLVRQRRPYLPLVVKE